MKNYWVFIYQNLRRHYNKNSHENGVVTVPNTPGLSSPTMENTADHVLMACLLGPRLTQIVNRYQTGCSLIANDYGRFEPPVGLAC